MEDTNDQAKMGAKENALTFVDHTLVDGQIYSTRIQRADDKALGMGKEFVDGTMETGHHEPVDGVPYETRHDWPVVFGEKIEMSDAALLEGVYLWTISMDGLDNHTALLIPAPRVVPDPELQAREEKALYDVLILSIVARHWGWPPRDVCDQAREQAQKIFAQRPVLVTVPFPQIAITDADPVLAALQWLELHFFDHGVMGALTMAMAASIVNELT